MARIYYRFKEAVNECSNALDAVPAYHKALVRRAKAYEQMGHFKQALSDIQKANKTDTANPEIQACPASSPCTLWGIPLHAPGTYDGCLKRVHAEATPVDGFPGPLHCMEGSMSWRCSYTGI